jgi:hypothetical protein
MGREEKREERGREISVGSSVARSNGGYTEAREGGGNVPRSATTGTTCRRRSHRSAVGGRGWRGRGRGRRKIMSRETFCFARRKKAYKI